MECIETTGKKEKLGTQMLTTNTIVSRQINATYSHQILLQNHPSEIVDWTGNHPALGIGAEEACVQPGYAYHLAFVFHSRALLCLCWKDSALEPTCCPVEQIVVVKLCFECNMFVIHTLLFLAEEPSVCMSFTPTLFL